MNCMEHPREHTCAKVSGFVNKRVRSDKNIGRARGTLPALAGSTVSWEDSFRFSVITANSLSQPRCAPSRVSVFYPEFGPRVPDDHPPASPPAFVAAARCPRCWGSSSTSIVRSSKEVPASSGKVCTPISPAIRKRMASLYRGNEEKKKCDEGTIFVPLAFLAREQHFRSKCAQKDDNLYE